MWEYFKRDIARSWGGLFLILAATWYQVQLDVQINDWFGRFYNDLQLALSGEINDVGVIYTHMFDFASIAGVLVLVAIGTACFSSFWCMWWRNSMANYYHDNWCGGIEGASQRVQEDTLKLARILETLGVGLVEALMRLLAFMPLLWVLSKQVTELPVIGAVEGSMVWIATLTALGGTVILAIVGGKLPGIEYDIQKREAAYRKALVFAEEVRKPSGIKGLYERAVKIHYKSFWHYLYFDATKWTFLQGMVVVPYIALAPTIVSGAVTLGFVTQISRAFSKVAESMQYMVRSWSTIVELISIHKRLREYERAIE